MLTVAISYSVARASPLPSLGARGNAIHHTHSTRGNGTLLLGSVYSNRWGKGTHALLYLLSQ
jgi:hypothetical protein